LHYFIQYKIIFINYTNQIFSMKKQKKHSMHINPRQNYIIIYYILSYYCIYLNVYRDS